MHLRVRIFCAVVLFVAGSVEATAATTLHWKIDGVDREAIVVAPRSARSLPVIFVFHGHGGTADTAARFMQFEREWPQALVVYPQGLNTPTPLDPDGSRPGWQREAGQLGDRDLKFFDAMLSTLRAKYRIDARRIFAAGFSNGAVFTFLLWAERPDAIKAVGICAGVLLPSVHLRQPRPVIHIAGRADEVARFDLQQKSIEAEHALDDPAHVPVREEIHDAGHVYPKFATEHIVTFFRELGVRR